MDLQLNDIEVRVLGSLIEKELATPDAYPLSLNALVNACNQKSNREPVVSFDEPTVLSALEGLKEKHLVWQSDASRVSKYAHSLDKAFNLVARETALLCLLMLRGAQTVGELRGRSERLHPFEELDGVRETLESLAEIGLVVMLPRQPGRKESRYVHLLAGMPEVEEPPRPPVDERGPPLAGAATADRRISALEEQIDALRQELTELRQAFTDFKSQFD